MKCENIECNRQARRTLRFADDIDGLAGKEEELVNLVERLDSISTAYGMQISAEKTKLITLLRLGKTKGDEREKMEVPYTRQKNLQ